MKDTIRPFSNGTEMLIWYEQHCDRCSKSFKPKNAEMPNFKTTQNLVNLGMECKFKFALDKSYWDGEFSKDLANQMGMKNDDIRLKCIHFSDDENDGWRPPKRKPKDSPDNQLCMPFINSEIDDCFYELKILNKELVS